MMNLTYDHDLALKTSNSSLLLLVYKSYADLYRMLLPFIHDKRIYENFVETIEAGKPELENLANGYINWCGISEIIYKSTNDMNNIL